MYLAVKKDNIFVIFFTSENSQCCHLYIQLFIGLTSQIYVSKRLAIQRPSYAENMSLFLKRC